MKTSWWVHIIRTVILLLLQILIFRRMAISIGDTAYVHFMIYPVAILLLPVRMPRTIVMLLALVAGLFVDSFYNSPGVHAGALVFLAYVRGPILDFLEPYEGYNQDAEPSIAVQGLTWMTSYVASALLVFLFVYFSLEAFSFIYIFSIFLDTIGSLIASFLLTLVMLIVFSRR